MKSIVGGGGDKLVTAGVVKGNYDPLANDPDKLAGTFVNYCLITEELVRPTFTFAKCGRGFGFTHSVELILILQ
ncbi:hypothetical protein L6452_08612 [Arctium lappa]|uniref:Uncharacterized protein n=1 Tax=Arctium lappa TaxID=4217 RepID=A0ACB9DI75_ARCLA|nr:hypothetical protein L6452_08612 [Arctium lappa]